MSIKLLTEFFMWSTILNAGILAIATLLSLSAGDFAYNLHKRWFPMSRETFGIIYYCFLGLYKIFIIVFNLVPWLVLLIIR